MIVANAKFKKMCMNLCRPNLPCILLFKYLLNKSFHLKVQDIIIFSEVDLALPYCQLCNMCVWYSLRNVECYIPHKFFDSSASINHVAFR